MPTEIGLKTDNKEEWERNQLINFKKFIRENHSLM